MHAITQRSPFSAYGFDVEISPKDSFVFTGAGGIFLLKVNREDGREIVRRRMYIDHDGSTEVFDVASLNKYEKELYIRKLKRMDLGNNEISLLLGLGYAYVSKIKRDPT